MRVITAQDWRTQPWPNGGGITHEIVRWPEDDERGEPDRDPYDVRVSLAEVATSGPFSRFPGYRRWTFLAGAAPIELAHDRTIVLTALGDHLELPGELALTATLHAGPTHLLNVLARIAIVVGHGPTAHPVRVAFALADRPQLARWSTAVFDAPARFDTMDCVWIA